MVETIGRSSHYSVHSANIYLPRDMGGRGFLSMMDVVEGEKRSLSAYLHNTPETILLNAKAALRISAMSTVDDFVTDAHQWQLDNWRNKW